MKFHCLQASLTRSLSATCAQITCPTALLNFGAIRANDLEYFVRWMDAYRSIIILTMTSTVVIHILWEAGASPPPAGASHLLAWVHLVERPGVTECDRPGSPDRTARRGLLRAEASSEAGRGATQLCSLNYYYCTASSTTVSFQFYSRCTTTESGVEWPQCLVLRPRFSVLSLIQKTISLQRPPKNKRNQA